MNLPDLIDANLMGLIDDRSNYAKTLRLNESPLSESQRHNSAGDILHKIAANMRSTQSAAQREAKSHCANAMPTSVST
jgi:hypothetical protein